MNIASLAKREFLATIALMALSSAGTPAWADPAAQTLDMAAYDQLKSLAGQWRARSDARGADGATLEIMVTSNGKAVLERLFAGTPNEMTTVYYLAYDKLLATHYCSIGNQPAYRLAPASTPTNIVMEFAGGTGFDPKTDQHAHGVTIKTIDASHLDVEWEFRKGDAAPTHARMLLERMTPTVAGS
jgi:hypothetical protein